MMSVIQSSLATLFSFPYNIVVVAVSVYLIRWYFSGGVCRSTAPLDGKTVIITGANTGIGKETAIDLAKRSARIILACRDPVKGEKAAVEVRKKSGNGNVIFHQLDLASLKSIRQFATRVLHEEPHIDILINNAGVMGCPYMKTVDGFEMQFGVNHLGHFLLTNLLLDRLKSSPEARIVNVSALLAFWGTINFDDINMEHSYSPFRAYINSKLANILFTRSLMKRLEGTHVTANALHPGVVTTELGRYNPIISALLKPFNLLFFKNVAQGAQTSIYCAVSEEMEGVSGKYLADCRIQRLKSGIAVDDDVAERLWELSAQMVGLQ